MKLINNIIEACLEKLFSRIAIPPSLKDIVTNKANKNLTLITQSDGIFLRALMASFARKLNLKANLLQDHPSLAKDALNWCSLHNESCLQSLLKTEKKITASALIILFWKGPLRQNVRYKTGWKDILTLILAAISKSKVAIINFTSPFTLIDGKHKTISRVIKVEIYKTIKTIRGAPFQTLDAQERAVLSGDEFEKGLEILAKRSKTPIKKMREKAKKEFRLIAANPRSSVYLPICYIGGFLINRLFEKITVNQIQHFSNEVKKNPVVLVPVHRSHLDYIIIGKVLFDSSLNSPLIAAGINLNFWPIGGIIKKLGAFYVKRNARKDRLHFLILKRYVTYLMKRGHVQEFFIEGGRSRNGRMRSPKMGLLSVFVNGYFKKIRKDVSFIPVSISYEQVVEDKEFVRENLGAGKIKENFKALLKARHILSAKYGEVVVTFGAPVRISEFIKKNALQNKDEREVVSKLAKKLVSDLNDNSSLTLMGLSSAILMSKPNYGASEEIFKKHISKWLNLAIKIRSDHIAKDKCCTMGLLKYKDAPEKAEFKKDNPVIQQAILPIVGKVFYIPGNKRLTADFYRNSIFHWFFELEMLGLLNLAKKDLSTENFKLFYNIFSNDFCLPDEAIFLKRVDATINILQLENYLYTRGKKLKLKPTAVPFINGGLFWATIQEYLLLLVSASNTKKKININTTYKELSYLYTHLKYIFPFLKTEVFSKASLQSALSNLLEQGVIADNNNILTVANQELFSIYYKFMLDLDKALRQYAGNYANYY